MKYSRCPFDEKPIHPTDKDILDTFRIWLRMDATDQYWAIRLDPEWRKFLGITDEMAAKHGIIGKSQ